MLFIVEILFFIIGVWGLIKGKFPGGLFRVVFGKGEYNLSPKKARLFGVLLISPWPMAILVGFILGLVAGQEGMAPALIFEIVYDLAVITTAVIIARRVRQPIVVMSSEMPPPLAGVSSVNALTPGKKTGLTILIFLSALIILSVFGTLVLTLFSIHNYGVRSTGNFWSDTFPYVLMILIIIAGIVGIVLTAKRLKRG